MIWLILRVIEPVEISSRFVCRIVFDSPKVESPMPIERRQAPPCGKVTIVFMVIAMAKLVNFDDSLSAMTA